MWTQAEDLEVVLDSIQAGVVVLDDERRRVLAINAPLARWISPKSGKSLLGGSPLDWIDPESRGPFLQIGDGEELHDPVRIRLLGANGPHDVDVRGEYRVNSDGDGRWVYWLSPPSAEPGAIEVLEDQILTQKRRAAEAVRTSMQIYQVAEKIRATPRLSAILIGVREEKELYERVGEFLLSEELHCRFVRILMLDAEGRLRCVWSSSRARDRQEALPHGSTLHTAITEDLRSDECSESRWETLESRGEVSGLLEIQLDPHEEGLLEDAPIFRQWLDEVIRTLAEIVSLFHENMSLYRKLESQALVDPLSGLFNRHHLFRQLEREVQRAHWGSAELSVVFADLDAFKRINDGHGHLVGDQLLTEVARILVESFRETDYLCRFGGDEFVAILPSTGESAALKKAQKLLKKVRSLRFEADQDQEGDKISLTLSIGVASLEAGDTYRDLLRRADEALYSAKDAGRDRAHGARQQAEQRTR